MTIDPMLPLPKLAESDAKVGAVVMYRGDSVHFESKVIFGKGRKIDNWMLPYFTETDGDPHNRNWDYVPTLANTNWVIDKIERDRLNKKGTKGLPDMWIVKVVPELRHAGSAGDTVGLVLEDLCAKFCLVEKAPFLPPDTSVPFDEWGFAESKFT